MNVIWKLIFSLAIPQLAGALGSIFTANSVKTWYKTINKSSLNPPDWVFAPVWTALFLMMGVSLFLIWNKPNGSEKNLALIAFGIQLALNVLWSIIFFGVHQPGWALLEILILWIAILITIILFYPISRTAAFLLIPYILWVSFASILNYQIWKLN